MRRSVRMMRQAISPRLAIEDLVETSAALSPRLQISSRTGVGL